MIKKLICKLFGHKGLDDNNDGYLYCERCESVVFTKCIECGNLLEPNEMSCPLCQEHADWLNDWDWEVVCDETNNSPEDKADNRVCVDVYGTRKKPINKITLKGTLDLSGDKE